MNNSPFVSIIIPCRNEEIFIGKCIESIVSNDYPKGKLEVLLIDGLSDDKTRPIINKYTQQYQFIHLLDNPKKIVPPALNIGVANAKGEIIIRMDAHTTYAEDYVTKCVESLQKYDAGNVGGIWVTTPGSDTVMAKSIALTLSHPFGVGNSYFRIGLQEPTYVDTVPFGCYKKEVIERVGLFNENLIRNQDIEFNLRLKKMGYKILLVPEIVSYYHARTTLNSLAKNNFANGYWVIYSSKFAKLPFSLRHLVPLFFVCFLFVTLITSFLFAPSFYVFSLVFAVYLMVGMFCSFKLSIKNGLGCFSRIILTFFTLHVSYGLGSLFGIFKLLTGKK